MNKLFDIHYLEMLAIFRGRNALLPDKTCTHVRVMSDNITAVVVMRNMGTIQKRILR